MKPELQTITNAPTIPEPYIIKGNWLYYRKVTEYIQKEDKIEDIYLTSTPPYITQRYRNIESKEFYYLLEFEDVKRQYKLPVTAQEVTQSKYLVELASRVRSNSK
ncbi:hypothetical protein J4710_02225 [Staphylococcus xylosus]|uniref:Uncharacterized protein n=1 Tax=Staphylococcus xylosus TaxID=1288 RepID=A0A939NFU7_STAXY|nr:hypothetical protein [Staphylococcus xylosus]